MRVLFKRLSPTRLRSLGSQFCRRLTSSSSDPHVAIVGSGPAGFYTAQQLIKGHPTLRVDIYEKLPVPFGLVRFGVAPDHPEVKNCINSFTQTARGERCSFIGNVEIGKDVTVAELQQAYTAVVLLPVDLDCETAVVLGHGNVALDVARVLLMPVDILAKTDISQYALEALSRSRIEQVKLVGRRGPLQVAFTIKELREMVTLPKCRTFIDPEDVAGINEKISDLPRPRRRLTDLLYTTAVNPAEKYTKIWADATRSWHLKFLRSPSEILSSQDGLKVEGVKFVINQLQGDILERQNAAPTDQTDVIPCGLVLRSIGYKGVPIDNTVPFDSRQSIVPNTNGRVDGCQGLYCSGWIAQGPVFVILGTMNDGFATGKVVLEDIASGCLPAGSKGGKEHVLSLLEQKAVKPVTFSEWEKIDKAEVSRGEKTGKPREKIASTEEMLHIAWS